MDPIIAATIFVLGLCFDSFLNVCIHRLPRDLSVVHPRSACPTCGTPIRAYDNVPVVSWLLLRGRCRACRAPISPRYLAVELLTALLFLAWYGQFGLTLFTLKYCVFTFLVLGLIFADAETKLLPDELTLGGLAFGVLFSIFVPLNDIMTHLLPVTTRLGQSVSPRVLSLTDSLVGAAVGAAFIYAAGAIYKLARRVEGMGFGDVKLMAMVGAFLGPKLTLLTLLAASVLGSVYGLCVIPAVWIKRTRRYTRALGPGKAARSRAWRSAKKVYRHYGMPFGVHLGAMAILVAFFGDRFLAWYWGLYF